VNGQYYTEVYRRSHDERGPVTYAPFGLAGSGDPLSLFGSTLLLSGEGSVELPPGTVDVYDLRKQASQSSSQP
jgi:hypothetical protein